MTALVIGIALGLIAAIHGARLAYRAGIRAGVAMSIVAMRHSVAPLTQAPPTETRH
jgi:hypothetical protein